MNFKNLFLPVVFGIVLLFPACRNKGLKADAVRIGDAMCRNIEIMNKLRATNPADTVTLQKLQSQARELQGEMNTLYQDFGAKYKERTKDPEFSKAFSRELRKAMLDCPYLSKEDKEQFEKELKE
jgi:hypothetical protein